MMNKITCHGKIDVHGEIVANADRIKHQHYQVNTPARFQTHHDINQEFKQSLAERVNTPVECLDFVYFSVCRGAEPHVDQLNPQVFKEKTYVIPVILPQGTSVITAEDEVCEVKLNHIYEFNHERVHSMTVEDTESGCVVIMVAEKR